MRTLLPSSDGVDEESIFGSTGPARNQSSSCCVRYPPRFDVYERSIALFTSGLGGGLGEGEALPY